MSSFKPINVLFVLSFFLIFIPGTLLTEPKYSYNYHNVVLDRSASKNLQINLACAALTSDSHRSGHIIFNAACERRPFHVKITVPDISVCHNTVDVSEKLRLYLNVRTLVLQDRDTLILTDPSSHLKKQLSARSTPYTIDFGLQSFVQLFSGQSATIEYTPDVTSSAQSCPGSDDDSTLLDIEYVLVSSTRPANLDNFRFTRCEKLEGYIPTGILCDQYSDNRTLACPVDIKQGNDGNSAEFATGQDRRDLDCYQLVLGEERDNIHRIMDGSMVVVTALQGPSSGARKMISTFLTLFFTTALSRQYFRLM